MSRRQSLPRVLIEAKKWEKKYDWLQAVEFYRKAQILLKRKKKFQKAGEIQENIGFCLQNAAMQAENHKDFSGKMQLSIEAYKKASAFYEKSLNSQIIARARKLRCEAIIRYLGFWVTSEPAGKIKLLDECLKLESKTLSNFSKSKDHLEYGKT